MALWDRTFWVYIMASRKGGALYVGVTNDLDRRIYEHQSGTGSVHALRYRIRRLVYAEAFPTAIEAIAYEKRIKKWHRAWKVALVEKDNPDWTDLSDPDSNRKTNSSFRP